MLSVRHFLAATSLCVLIFGSALGQGAAPAQNRQSETQSVTASASAAGVRFAAPGEAVRVRVQVSTEGGQPLFDRSQEGGVFDWKLEDETGARLPDGSYLVTVTAETLAGEPQRRVGVVTVANGHAALSAADAGRARAAAPDAAPLTIVSGPAAVTAVTHDGAGGVVSAGKGALSLRTGDVLAGTDREQVRITPEGRVGVGTDNPQAALDVAGEVRAQGGIRFGDGTVLTSAKDLKAGAASNSSTTLVADTGTANIAGTGTTNRLARWLDGAGNLGDSVITETAAGNIGVSNASPTTKLSIMAAPGAEMRFDKGALSVTPVLSVISQPGSTTAGAGLTLGAGTEGSSFVFSDNKPFYIIKDTKANVVNNNLGFGTPVFTILPSGNAGLGTSNPTAKFEVTGGDIKVTGAGRGIIFPDGTKLTTAGGGGGSMTGTQIVSAINAAGTSGQISDAHLSPTVARLNGANAWSGVNSFANGLSANNALVTNVGNPVNAGDAVNKAYADANFVKFVPGAEQLSVGDANGTAPMINLRGGSTCCSGPGGHTPAFFKVFQNGSFVATGNLGIGTSPMEGKGYRTSWHTYKGAFRSGYADNEWDDANVGFFSWAGGSNSTASGLYALAFGDTNFARSTSSIAFGSGNEVKGAAGFSAGAGNRVCDTYGVALGNNARSGGPYIDGKCDPETFNIRGLAAVAIGYNVTADQDHTMALGKFASNNGFQGTFIWSDGAPQASADTFRNTANNEFAARATGGFRFRTNLGGTTGCNLPAGSGVFNCTSSRTTKENFFAVSGEDVLSKLRKIEVSTWNYITEGQQVRHMGPMAEDFHAAFGLGSDNKAIGVQDLAGVSLAAVKALEERTAELKEKSAEVDQLRERVQTLEQRLAAIEAALKANEK